MEEKSFEFDKSWHEALSIFSDEDYGEMVRAICRYVFDGEDACFNTTSKEMAWTLIKARIDGEFNDD